MQLCSDNHSEIAYTCAKCPVCEAIQEQDVLRWAKNEVEEVAEELRGKVLDWRDTVDALTKERDDLAKLLTEATKDNDRLTLEVQDLEDRYVDKQAR